MTNKATKTAETVAATKVVKTKKVLTEKDIPLAGKTQSTKELKAETERELRKIAAETGSNRANSKQPAQLANGVTAQAAPHSAKAISDAASKGRAAKASNKADAATQKAPTPKAPKTTTTNADTRKYKVLVKLDDINLRPDTWTKVMVETALGHTDTASANAALTKDKTHGQRKIDWKWIANTRKYIAFT